MNRQEIKELAKEKIRGNKWNIWWPALVIGVLSSALTSAFGPKVTYDFTNFNYTVSGVGQVTFGNSLGVLLIAILTGLLTAGYIKYLINFVRTGKFNSKDIIDTVKEKWLNIIIADILVSIVVALCTMLFIIPGIIMSLAYAFVNYLVVDTKVSGSDALKTGREMMKGYKWNYFVFGLSFIGWFFLMPFTLGILAIWLVPYVQIAQIIYYDKLKEKAKIK